MSKYYVSAINHKQRLLSPNKQTGGVLIIAIFIIVVLSLLGASMLNLQQTSAKQGIYDVYATRASFAAYSANEVAMLTVFKNKKNTEEASICLGEMEKVPVVLPQKISGFANCQAYYTCQLTDSKVGHVYTLVSAAFCSDKEMKIYREVTTKVMR